MALLAGLAFAGVAVEAQDLAVSNTSRYIGDGQWDWKIFITGAPDVLNRVRCVEYRLHSTFPDPVRRICERGRPDQAFSLQSSGWGTFEIQVRVTFANGEVRSLRHALRFETPAPGRPRDITANNTSIQVRSGWWNWTIFVEGPDEVLRRIRCVEYRLHPTFPDRVRTVCERGAGPQAFALSSAGWGTFQIGIRIVMDTGSIYELTHDLAFR